MADGKTVQDMVEEDILKDWAKWNNPPILGDAWIGQAYESLSGQARKSISETLTYTIVENGVKAAIEQYHELKNNQPDSHDFGENQLNTLGYQLLWRDMLEAAIEVFKLNIEIYPQSANPYDSLGEAYMASGHKELAIENYEKALALDPNLPSAIDALKKLNALAGGS